MTSSATCQRGWERPSIPHDEALYGDRPHFVSRVWLDGDVAWLFVEYRGGASFPAPAVYVGQDGRWQTVADELGARLPLAAMAKRGFGLQI